MKKAGVGICLVVALAHDGRAQQDEPWRLFEGSWSAVGQVETLPTEGSRSASIVRLSGSLTLKTGEGLRGGFRGEVIAFDDGSNVRVGRAVWTDERGDRIYSELTGEPIATGRKVSGRIGGGTGRYRNVTGEYEATWQYVVRADEGVIQGRAADLRGRFRLQPQQP